MNLTTFVTILIIYDLCMVITQSAGSGDDQNYPRTPRPDLPYMKSAKDKRLRSSYDNKMSKRRRFVGESSPAGKSRTGKTRMEHNLGDEMRIGYKKKTWTNEEQSTLLRLAYAHYHSDGQNSIGSFDWKPVVERWHGEWDPKIRDILKSQTNNLQKKMRKAVEKFDNGVNHWPRQNDDELLKIYFATEAEDESKHAEKIYAEWVLKHPNCCKVTPAYLLERAETMLFSVMKFSLENPQGKVKPKQPVDWKPEHKRLLRFLWDQIPKNVASRKQQLYNEAVKYCEAMQHLDEERVYRHAQWLSVNPVKENEEISHIHGGYVPDTAHAQYHPFMDAQHFPALDLGHHGHHVGMPSTSSQPGPSHGHPESNLDLIMHHFERENLNTNSYLGYRYY